MRTACSQQHRQTNTCSHLQLAAWSSDMILAHSARSPVFNSQSSPVAVHRRDTRIHYMLGLERMSQLRDARKSDNEVPSTNTQTHTREKHLATLPSSAR